MEMLNLYLQKATKYFEGFSKTTADTFAWLSMLVFICATVPSFFAVMSGVTDKLPPLDITCLLWLGLLLYFLRSAILKDMLMVVTIGIGFAIQSIMLGLIFFI
jgi:hypothetical protein